MGARGEGNRRACRLTGGAENNQEGAGMATDVTPVRRVVTGNDTRGRSCVLIDSAAPNVNANAIRPGKGMTDLWVFDACPALIAGARDDGDLPFHFEPPERGGHLRIVQSPAWQPDYDPARDASAVPLHAPRQRPGGTWERGGANAFTSATHRSQTVDYGILIEGERVLILDDGEYVIKPGDVVVQVGNWHAWGARGAAGLMAFVMMAAHFEG